MNIFREYSDVVEQYSIDEAFMDMAATCHLFGTPEETAEQIKNRIKNELGFTVNVGISRNKLLVKMASDLFFVGCATAKKLFSMGIIVKDITNC